MLYRGIVTIWLLVVSVLLLPSMAMGQTEPRLFSHTFREFAYASVPYQTLATNGDGSLLVVGGGESANRGSMALWNVKTNTRTWGIRMTSPVRSLAFSSDGTRIAVGLQQGQVSLLDLQGRLVRSAKLGAAMCTAVAFSPRGDFVAAGGSAGRVALFAASTMRQTTRLPPPRRSIGLAQQLAQINALRFSGSGTRLLIATKGGYINCWDLQQKKYTAFQRHSSRDLVMEISGNMLATGSTDGSIRLWSVPKLHDRGQLRGHAHEIRSIAFMPDDQHVLSVDGRRTGIKSGKSTSIRMWEIATAQPRLNIPAPGDRVRAVAAVDGGFVTAGDDKRLVRFTLAGQAKALGGKSTARVSVSLAYVAASNSLACGCVDGSLVIREAAMGNEIKLIAAHDDAIVAVAASPDKALVATASFDGTVKIWDSRTWELRAVCRGHQGWVQCLDFSHDSRQVVSGGRDKSVRVWDLKGKQTRRWEIPAAVAVRVSSNGRVVAGGETAKVYIWSLTSGGLLQAIEARHGTVRGLAISPKNDWLATAGDDASVRIWDLGNGTLKRFVNVHGQAVRSLICLPSGETLVTGELGGPIRIWDPTAGQHRMGMAGHPGQGVAALAYSPVTHFIYSCGFDGSIRAWPRLGTR